MDEDELQEEALSLSSSLTWPNSKHREDWTREEEVSDEKHPIVNEVLFKPEGVTTLENVEKITIDYQITVYKTVIITRKKKE